MKLALALALLLALAPATAHSAPSPRAILPAASALEVGGTLALWSPDLRSVLGHSLTGERRWRLATGDQGGLRDLQRLGTRLLVYAGTEAILVDPATGKTLGRRPNILLPGPGVDPLSTCRVEEVEGACALRCRCSFELVSCETLAPIGPRVDLPHIEETDPDGARGTHCPMFTGGLVGRAGDVIIAATPVVGDKLFFAVAEQVVARSAKDGSELWRREAFGRFDEALSGVAPDGKTCYLGRRSGSITVFDCQRAEVLWERKLTFPRGVEPQVEVVASPRPTLLVRDGREAVALDLATGAPSWRAPLPEGAIFLLDPPASRRLGVKVELAHLLDAASGRLLAELPLPPGTRTTPERAPWGWLVVGDTQIEAFDPAGRALGGWKVARVTGAAAGPDVLAFSSPDGVRVVAPSPEAQGRDVLTLALRSARPVALAGPSGSPTLAVFVDGKGAWDPKDPTTFGELQLHALTR